MVVDLNRELDSTSMDNWPYLVNYLESYNMNRVHPTNYFAHFSKLDKCGVCIRIEPSKNLQGRGQKEREGSTQTSGFRSFTFSMASST